LYDGQIQNPSNSFGIVPLSNFVPRGFGFVHHSIAILYHQVPNPNLTIRNFFIAVQRQVLDQKHEFARALAALRQRHDAVAAQVRAMLSKYI
jgi:hypothetical protein